MDRNQINRNRSRNENSSKNIKILSWNVQSTNNSRGSKFNDKEFLNILCNSDIICLQEVRQESKIPGFRTKSTLRDGEKDGGVSILYKNELHRGINKVNKFKMDDLIIIKLNKTFFKLENDIFILNCYITPHNSSGKNKRNGKDMISSISDIINELNGLGEVILCGDFNSRISNNPCLIKHDDPCEHVPLPDDYIPDSYFQRNSQDRYKNDYNTEFTSLIMDNNLVILNGRTLGDLVGSYTCIRPTGCSVVDYFAVTHKLMNNVTFLEAQAFTPFSDHRPLALTLKTNFFYTFNKFKQLNEIYDSAPSRYIFNDTNLKHFTEIQNMDEIKVQMTEIREQISSLSTNFHDRNDIVNVNNAYIKYIQTVAQSSFKMTNNKH